MINKSLLLKALHQLIPISLFFSVLSFTVTVSAETFKARSSQHPVALVELYTSQGCSSCPPAEKWLGNLEKSGISNKQVVPLALHVDYWDYIGWKDQFAHKYFTQRQYQYKNANHSSSVYTPQIMFNGKDVRGVSFNRSLGDLNQQQAAVDFNLEATTIDSNMLKVKIDFNRIDASAKDSRLVLVLAENNLIGEIHAGENEGRTLQHQHVVRVWKDLGRLRKQMAVSLPIKKGWNKANLELVAFVETSDLQTQQALQLVLK